jgi:uncharacterized RDD family membrane protein YckC
MTTFSEFQKNPVPPSELIRSQRIPPAARPFQGNRAGLFSRVAADVIDVVAISVLMVGLYFGLIAAEFIFIPETNVLKLNPYLFLAAGYFVMWLYWTWSWATTGRTLGKGIMGLRVLNHKGERMRWSGAALRSGFCLVFPFGLLWTVVSNRNRSVQDVVLRTSVVNDWGETVSI